MSSAFPLSDPVRPGAQGEAAGATSANIVNIGARPTLALYVHWPFCVSKCPYCDFNSHVRESVDQEAWREA